MLFDDIETVTITKQIHIFTDGGSRGNPGPAGAGWAIYDTKVNLDEPMSTGSKFLGTTTNNVAEWQGLLLGVKQAIDILGKNIEVTVFMDSELVVKQVKGIYKVKQPHLKPFLVEINKLKTEIKKFEISHIYRKNNKLADSLANQAMDKNT